MICIYIGLLIVAITVALVFAKLRLRRGRAELVIQTLASISGQNLPLPAALRAAAVGERRGVRRAFTRVADDLERGDRLSDALSRSLPGCPAEALGAVRGGEASGTVVSVLASFAARLRRTTAEPAARNVSGWYTIMLLIVVPLVLLFLVTMIIPKYRAIFADFHTVLPAMTVSVLQASAAVGDYAPAFAAFIILLAIVALVQRLLVRRPDRLQLSFAVLDTAAWHLPYFRQSANAAALSAQLPVMHAAIRAGRDLGEAAEHATCTATNIHARRRLLKWAERLKRGDGALDSARVLGFPPAFMHALSNARDAQDLAGGFEYLAEYYRGLCEHRRRLAIDFITPLVVATWAFVIGYIVIALFLPLVSLVQSVMDVLD